MAVGRDGQRPDRGDQGVAAPEAFASPLGFARLLQSPDELECNAAGKPSEGGVGIANDHVGVHPLPDHLAVGGVGAEAGVPPDAARCLPSDHVGLAPAEEVRVVPGAYCSDPGVVVVELAAVAQDQPIEMRASGAHEVCWSDAGGEDAVAPDSLTLPLPASPLRRQSAAQSRQGSRHTSSWMFAGAPGEW